MSEILGFGINVYRQYESGEMPSVSNGRLIQLAKDPTEFRKLVEYSRNEFEPKEVRKVLLKIDDYEADIEIERSFEEHVMLGGNTPMILNGYRRPDLKKVEEMIFFSHNKCSHSKR